MAKKAALYLRSSKDRHDVSVESQRRELSEYVQQKGVVIVAEFVDKVESAKTDDRPAFQAMVSEAKSKDCRFNVVYCYDTSRFSRRQYHAQMYKHLFKKRSIELCFLKLPKTDTILDPIIESLMEAFDEFHSQKSKLDGLRGMRENIKQGWRAGGRAILGYQLEKHVVGTREGNPVTKSKLITDPKTFTIIQQYLKGRAKGESRKALIAELKLDIPYTTLAYIEESVLTYAGHTVWNRHNEYADGEYVGGKKFRDKSEWVINRNTHEAIITEKEAEAILAQREKQRIKSTRFRKNHYLLSGLLKCACGANMDGDSGFYRCHDRCGSRGIKKETIEQAVINVLFSELLTMTFMNDLKAEIAKQYKDQSKNKVHILQALKKEMHDIEREITELVKLMSQVKHQRPLLARLDNLEEERLSLHVKHEKEMANAKPPILNDSTEMIKSFLEHYRFNLEAGSTEKRKAVLRSVIERGVFDGETLEIIPSYQQIAGVNLASPRGFEPLLPP